VIDVPICNLLINISPARLNYPPAKRNTQVQWYNASAINIFITYNLD